MKTPIEAICDLALHTLNGVDMIPNNISTANPNVNASEEKPNADYVLNTQFLYLNPFTVYAQFGRLTDVRAKCLTGLKGEKFASVKS